MRNLRLDITALRVQTFQALDPDVWLIEPQSFGTTGGPYYCDADCNPGTGGPSCGQIGDCYPIG